MVHATIFSGHEGQLRPGAVFYLTLFAGCTLKRPTVARQIAATKQSRGDAPVQRRKPFFLTIFGGAEIEFPTLAEEYLDLVHMLDAGSVTIEDWDQAMARSAAEDGVVASLTLFGAFDECALPSETREIDTIALQRHLGNISEDASHVLQCAIGQADAERRATVRRAALVAA